jgi:hypothetical protein
MLPGTTLDANILLQNPYPVGKEVTVLRQEAQLIAKTGHNSWRPVPLSEVTFFFCSYPFYFVQKHEAYAFSSQNRGNGISISKPTSDISTALHPQLQQNGDIDLSKYTIHHHVHSSNVRNLRRQR